MAVSSPRCGGKYNLFSSFSPWRDPRLRHFSGYPFGVSRKKHQLFSITQPKIFSEQFATRRHPRHRGCLLVHCGFSLLRARGSRNKKQPAMWVVIMGEDFPQSSEFQKGKADSRQKATLLLQKSCPDFRSYKGG